MPRTRGITSFAGLAREEGRRHAHVPVVGAGRLLEEIGRVGLPPEAAEREAASHGVVDEVRPAGDSVAVAVAWIGQRQDLFHPHGLEQTQPKDDRRDARGDENVGRQRLIQAGECELGDPEGVGSAIGELPSHLGPGELRLRLGSESGDRSELELITETGDGSGPPIRAPARHARAEQQGAEQLGRHGRPSAPVAEVARLAGDVVEHRAEPGVLGRGRGNELGAEVLVPRVVTLEIRGGEIGRRVGEGVW